MMPGRCRPLALLAALCLATPVAGRAQDPAERLLVFRNGVSLRLPAGWALRDSAEVAGVTDTAVALYDRVRDTTLVHVAVRPQMLLVADGPGVAMTLGVGPSDGADAHSFDGLSDDQRERFRATMCGLLARTQEQLGRPRPHCGALASDSIAGRSVLILQYLRDDPIGQLHAWMVYVPTRDAVVTLSLLSSTATAATNQGRFSAIWQTLSVPEVLWTSPLETGR